MSRSVFGWSLPPGAAGDRNAPWNQEEGPCNVCGQSLDNCICPECPVCGGVGDPGCYTSDGGEPPLRHRWTAPTGDHGLVRSFAQVALRAETDRLIAEDARRDDHLWDEMEREQELAREYWASEGCVE